jgi:hypothetical protein
MNSMQLIWILSNWIEHNIFFLSNQQQVNVLIEILIELNFIELNTNWLNWIFFIIWLNSTKLWKFNWALCYFVLLVTMNFKKKKNIYVILVHILGRERCIYCLWSFINVFAFVSKNILRLFRIKPKHNVCCITFVYVYNKLFRFISLHNN